jgi:hypothetical protein
VAAADVGHDSPALEAVDDTVERRQPGADELPPIRRPERTLGAAEQAIAVLVPAHATAAAEALLDALAAGDHGVRGLEDAGHRQRAGLVGEHERVLDRQRVAIAHGVVGDEPAGGLRVEPLAHVALLRGGALAELGGAHRLRVGHRAVQAEPIADRHQRRVERGADLGGKKTDEGLQTGLVEGDGHAGSWLGNCGPPPWCGRLGRAC